MLWLIWRQHRGELLAAALLLAVVAVPLIVTGVAMHQEYQSGGIGACVADPAGQRGCAQLVDQFLGRHTEWGNRLVWVTFLPALAGVFIGAPLLAREFEHGTWRLAFTQSVTRTRWLAAKLALVGAGVAVLACAFATLFTWWRAPLDELGGRLRTAAFIVAAPSLASLTLLAFAVGVLAGALLRRTIAAMAVTLAVFITLRLTMEEYLRPRYRTPLVRITDPTTRPDIGWRPSTDWAVDNGWIDGSGQRLTDGRKSAIIRQIYDGNRPAQGSGNLVEQYMAEHGLRHYTEYHPGSSFWAFQAIESIWALGLAAVLLATTIWIVRRRTM